MYYWIITGLFILSPENAWAKLSGHKETKTLGLDIAVRLLVLCEAHKEKNLH